MGNERGKKDRGKWKSVIAGVKTEGEMRDRYPGGNTRTKRGG